MDSDGVVKSPEDYTKYELDRLRLKNPEYHKQVISERKNLRSIRGKQKSKNWAKNNPEKAKRSIQNANYKRKYGITFEQYEEMYISQNGLCKICNSQETITTPSGTPILLAVDHCHSTGKIRGLLCRSCNLLIGNAQDDTNILLNAIAYLQDNYDN